MTRRARLRPLLAALLVLPLAGCLGAGEGDERHMFGGRFASNATDAQREALYARILAAGGIVETTADLPTSHFGARDLAPDACRDVREWAARQRYVAEAGPCRVDPDGNTRQ